MYFINLLKKAFQSLKPISMAALLVAFMQSGCLIQDDHDDHDHGAHMDAVGLVIKDAAFKEVFRVFEGKTDDTLYAPSEGTSDHYTITFLEKDLSEVPEAELEGKTLAWDIADTSLFSIWQHEGEEGGFEFHFKGKGKTGSTTIVFKVMHGDHADFKTPAIAVVVSGLNEQ